MKMLRGFPFGNPLDLGLWPCAPVRRLLAPVSLGTLRRARSRLWLAHSFSDGAFAPIRSLPLERWPFPRSGIVRRAPWPGPACGHRTDAVPCVFRCLSPSRKEVRRISRASSGTPCCGAGSYGHAGQTCAPTCGRRSAPPYPRWRCHPSAGVPAFSCASTPSSLLVSFSVSRGRESCDPRPRSFLPLLGDYDVELLVPDELAERLR